MTDVRDQISRIILERAFKQCVIAERAGMPPDRLNATLKKRRKMEANELFRICSAMGMTPDEVAAYGKEN